MSKRKGPGLFSGEKLAQWREQAGLTQEGLGRKLARLAVETGKIHEDEAGNKFSGSSVSKWERGEHVPSFDTAVLIAYLLGIHVEDLAE